MSANATSNTSRELLATRLGFLLLSAGCAIGLGNIWRFPYISGRYGGLVFLGAYLFFLLSVGLPIMIMEFSIGRAAKKNMGKAFQVLKSENKLWHRFGVIAYVAPILLMMFYIPVTSWLVAYCYHMATGALTSLSPDQVGAFFGGVISNPADIYMWSLFVLFVCFGVCAMGLQKGVERVVKYLMIGLLLLLVILAANSLSLSGAKEGMEFYLAPDLQRAKEAGIWNLINDAMTQAFFTASIGVGNMIAFGSYFKRERSLTGEASFILGLDTFVALMAGVIIFPACFTFGIEPNAGPPLIFITLPNVFNAMTGGYFWGLLFFIFMALAAITTVIAVLECIISYSIDTWGWTRKKSLLVNFALFLFLVVPCILGFSSWSHIQPLGAGTNILDLEDFILSNNMLPIGCLVILFFCTTRYGWGFDNFIEEANTGTGMKFPRYIRFYLAYILPVFVFIVFVQGYFRFF